MAQATKDMIIHELLQMDPGSGIAEILMKSGMRCVGCPSARGETLEQAAGAHGANADELAEEINNYLQGLKLA
ncbi:MAG: DUF1858 domain-containing protein [Defluviitaleaceae bacterium]|nr:DUF1858 domain-containing protein [Defluviitaleaceae bacterium]MCL2835233.1 DUF1858 domain-containing protein [Defluviitaleaceae bacterium]